MGELHIPEKCTMFRQHPRTSPEGSVAVSIKSSINLIKKPRTLQPSSRSHVAGGFIFGVSKESLWIGFMHSFWASFKG